MKTNETTQDTSTEEQRHGSAEAITEPKDKEQELPTNNAAPNTFTEEERQLAEKYEVETKTVRLIAEIVSEHTGEITELLNLVKTNREQDAKEQVPTSSGPGEGPTDEKPTRDLHLQKALVDVLRPISCYNARFRHEVLTAALEDVSKTIKPADKLLAMEEQVRKICDGLDVKTKAVIAILGELAAVEGYTIGVEYGSDILHGELRGKALVDEARKQLPDDPDLTCLAKIYELAKSISKAEDERHGFRMEESANEETAEEELQTTDQADEQPMSQTASTETKEPKPEGNPTLFAVKKWLNKRSYAEKLTAVVVGRLIMVESMYEKPDNLNLNNKSFSLLYS